MKRAALELLSKEELIELVLRLDRRCEELERQNAELKKENTELAARCGRLEKRCTELEAELAKARKNSSNSSKPPSSDIVKPPRPPSERSNGKIGGQPGHPRHERPSFPPEQVDKIVKHRQRRCPKCGGAMRVLLNVPPRVLQQVELVKKPVRVTEHRAFACQCKECGGIHYGRLPLGGLMGPRLLALLIYLKGACHGSYTTVQAFLEAVIGLRVSCGYLAKQVGKVARMLDGPYQELLGRLSSEPRLGVDETGHKERGRKFWTWCFRAAAFVVFLIDRSRGSIVLLKTLGKDFKGVLGCDYFGAYRKYMGTCNVLVQFCLAHLIRDVKFLLTVPDIATRNYAERVLRCLRQLFHVIHRRDSMSEVRFQKAMELARQELVQTAKRAPMGSQAQNLAKRFRKYGAAYTRFITTPGVEPTNNLTEQALRFVVIDRRVTQGTRGAMGRCWCERIWTTLATCRMQRRSAFEYLHHAIRCHYAGRPATSLLAAS